MPQPEIAFDLTPLQNSHRHRGIGTYVRGLSQRLIQQHEIPIEFWGWAGRDAVEVGPPHTSLLLQRMPSPQYRGAWVVARLAMRRRAGRSRARAVHITDPDALIPLRGRKMLTTVYDLIPMKHGFGGRQLIARAGYDSYLKSLARADVLFAISRQTADDLRARLHIPAARIELAIPGVDIPTRPAATRGGRPYFLYIGGPNPNKNLPALLAAMSQAGTLEEELLVAGHWLPKQVASLDGHPKVRHIGFVPADELLALMRGATALVIPSLDEGFGLPVAEGLAAGAVVVHSNLPVLDEISKGAALTFDPRSAADIAACLTRVASDQGLREKLQREGRKRAEALTWDAAVATTLAAYRRVLGS